MLLYLRAATHDPPPERQAIRRVAFDTASSAPVWVPKPGRRRPFQMTPGCNARSTTLAACPAEFKLRFNVYKKIVVSAGLVTSEEEEAWCLSAHVALVLLRDLPLLKSHDTSRYIDLDKTSAFHKGSRDTRRVRHWDRARTPGAE